MQSRLAQLNNRLTFAFAAHLKRHKTALSHQQVRLMNCHPEHKLQLQGQRTDELSQRLKTAMLRRLAEAKSKPEQLLQRLQNASPHPTIGLLKQQQRQLSQRLRHSMSSLYASKASQFAHLAEQLHMVSPLATIARGYSISRKQSGEIIKDSQAVSEGDSIEIQLANGSLEASVTAVKD